MRLLLDTHVWIWWLLGQDDLPARDREALDRLAAEEPPLLSAISLWEAQMLHARRRLELSMPFEAWLHQATAADVVRILPLDAAVILAAGRLPESFQGDPADRIIVACARQYGVPLASWDRRIRRSRLIDLWKPGAAGT